LEEAISPIPSFVVMIPAGAAARVQGAGWWYLVELSFFAACGRIIAAMLLYVIAAKAEGWLFGKGRRFFGVDHKKLQDFGRRFSGSGRDWLVLFLISAVPVLPTAYLSLACGFIKIDFRMFVVATFFGSAVNAFLYMGAAYLGAQAIAAARHLEAATQIVLAILVLACVAWLIYYRRKKRQR